MSGLTEIELKQQIDELLDIRDALSQKLRAAQHESEALAATVEAFVQVISERFTSKELQPDGTVITDGADWALKLLATTLQHHLREIRAEAGRVGFVVGCEYAIYYFCSDADKKWFEDNYADKIGWGEL